MLTPEQIENLKDLRYQGVISEAAYQEAVNPSEKWQISKFLKGLFSINNLVMWGKDITRVFNIRMLIIYCMIAGSIYGYGYLKGTSNKPIQINGLNGKEVVIEIDKNSFFHITKDGSVQIEDKSGKVVKLITAKDIPNLQQALKPIGFQLNPIFVSGVSTGKSKVGLEVGAGFSYFKFYRVELDAFATNKAIYPIGLSYRLNKISKGNTSIGVAAGKGYKGDNRIMGYFRWEF